MLTLPCESRSGGDGGSPRTTLTAGDRRAVPAAPAHFLAPSPILRVDGGVSAQESEGIEMERPTVVSQTHCWKCFKDRGLEVMIADESFSLCSGCAYVLSQWTNFLKANGIAWRKIGQGEEGLLREGEGSLNGHNRAVEVPPGEFETIPEASPPTKAPKTA